MTHSKEKIKEWDDYKAKKMELMLESKITTGGDERVRK